MHPNPRVFVLVRLRCSGKFTIRVAKMKPWQTLTLGQRLRLALPLKWLSPSGDCMDELRQISKTTPQIVQSGPFHDGSWTVIPLVSPDGAVTDQSVNAERKFLPTKYLRGNTAASEFLNSLPGVLWRVRLSRLPSGKSIDWHYDDFEKQTGERVLRLHVPIVTETGNVQTISHENTYWSEGVLYLGDYRFPHQVENNSSVDRVHMIIDLVPSDALLSKILTSFRINWFSDSRRAVALATQRLYEDWRNR